MSLLYHFIAIICTVCVSPSEVRVRGNLEPNIFKTKAGQEVKDIRIQGRFVNRLNVGEDTPHQAIVRLSGLGGGR